MNRSLWADRSRQSRTPPDVIAAVAGAHLLVGRLGSWPEFPDFEVVFLHFNRGHAMKVFGTKAWPDLSQPSLIAVFTASTFGRHRTTSNANRP
jgi:hypothetical protein